MRAFPASAALVAALVLTAGCTDSDDRPATPELGDSPAAPTTTTPAETTPTATATTAPTPDALPLVDRLLPTGRVPGLNAQWQWQDGDTGEPHAEPFGLCAKADLLSIGATEVVARTYFPPDDSDDNAAEQVAEFPDAQTARSAWAVLEAWHRRCGRTISADLGLKVRPIASVPVTAGTARWYLLSWTPVGEETGRFEAFGMVLNGTRVAVLRMDHSGLDHNYPPGQDPMVGMVSAAAALLG